MGMSRKERSEALADALELIKDIFPRRAVLTCQEVAELTEHNYETVRRLLDSGAIRPRPRKKAREAYRVPINEVARYMAEGPRNVRAVA